MQSMWQMWHNYATPEKCNNIITQALTIPPVEATTYGQVPGLRTSKVRWLNRNAAEWQWLYSDIDNVCRRANTAFGFDLNFFYEVQFTEYEAETKSHYGWHEDVVWIPKSGHNTQRKLSFVMQLSDPSDYEGGDFEFQLNTSQPPKAEHMRARGNTLVFPSFLRHRVTPVTKGTRYSLVTWYEGPPFR